MYKKMASKFCIKVMEFERTDEKGLKLVKSNLEPNYSRKKFVTEIPKEITFEWVDKEPENFQFNKIYLRNDGKFVWIFSLKEEDDNSGEEDTSKSQGETA